MKLKRLIATLACSSLVGNILKFLFSKIKYKESILVNLRTPNISAQSAASVFWGLYEKAEAIFILKYLRTDLDVVELGASIGVISCIVANKIDKNNTVVNVEPNVAYFEDITLNLKLNQLTNCQTISKAYSSKAKTVLFETSSHNIAGKVLRDGNKHSDHKITEIPSCSLQEILVEGNIMGDYVLVCDIEGAEIEIFLNDTKALERCKQIIIETHATNYRNEEYTPSQIKDIITNQGFKLVDSKGPVFVFEKQ